MCLYRLVTCFESDIRTRFRAVVVMFSRATLDVQLKSGWTTINSTTMHRCRLPKTSPSASKYFLHVFCAFCDTHSKIAFRNVWKSANVYNASRSSGIYSTSIRNSAYRKQRLHISASYAKVPIVWTRWVI